MKNIKKDKNKSLAKTLRTRDALDSLLTVNILLVFCHYVLVITFILYLAKPLPCLILSLIALTYESLNLKLKNKFKQFKFLCILIFLLEVLFYKLYIYMKTVPLLPINYAQFRVVPGLSGITSGYFDVLITMNGGIRAPYPTEEIANVISAAAFDTFEDIYITENNISIIIPARNEELFLVKTLNYIFETTPDKLLNEIIIVDDASKNPLKNLLDGAFTSKEMKKIKLFRMDKPEGLIRARMLGAYHATASNIVFLDAHCKPVKNWLPPLLQQLQINYRRVVCPVIEDIDQKTWEPLGTSGRKMIMEWTFEFHWFEDLTIEIPISAGGIMALTKKWWHEVGEYDYGMLEWGGENIEFSLRVWLAGGEITYEASSLIGHIFSRPPREVNNTILVNQVWRNQHSAAKVWLDEFYPYFLKKHKSVLTVSENDNIDNRLELKKKLNTLPFRWYLHKFRTALERKAFFDFEGAYIIHKNTQNCLLALPEEVKIGACTEDQLWVFNGGRRLLYSLATNSCLTLHDVGKPTQKMIMSECAWTDVFTKRNLSQLWMHDELTERIFSCYELNTETVTGNDIFTLDRSLYDIDAQVYCLVVVPNSVSIQLEYCSREISSQGFYMKRHNTELTL